MAVVYFDSSALVKLVVEEAGSELAAELWDGCDAAVSSRLAYPEVRAALAAAGRNHDLDPAGQAAAEDAWEEYWSATRPVELTARSSRALGSSLPGTRCAAPTRYTWPAPWPSASQASSWPPGTGGSATVPRRPDSLSPPLGRAPDSRPTGGSASPAGCMPSLTLLTATSARRA